jgi:hypothetical protein
MSHCDETEYGRPNKQPKESHGRNTVRTERTPRRRPSTLLNHAGTAIGCLSIEPESRFARCRRPGEPAGARGRSSEVYEAARA